MATEDLAYCPRCGTELDAKEVEGRTRRYCHDCERPVYRNPKPCAGVLVVDDRDRLLLVERTNPPAAGTWSLPAGYLEHDEPPRAAAGRELREETGLDVSTDVLELFDTTFGRSPGGHHSLVVIYVAARAATDGTVRAGSDAADARFWALSALEASAERVKPGYASLFERAVEAVGGG